LPEVAILDIPFLMRDYAHARAVLDGPIGQEMLAEVSAKRHGGARWGENGFRHMTNSKRPSNGPDDLKGLKMRTMEKSRSHPAYKQVRHPSDADGVQPRCSPRCSRAPSTARMNPLSVISAAKFDQVQKYMTLTGHVYSLALILMGKAAWDKLARRDKDAFMAAAKEAVKANRARIDETAQGRRRSRRRKGHQSRTSTRQVPGIARADVRRVRQEVRPGQHRQIKNYK
jgi:TRAP-type C4-dicarboxylate transport system substrate-binding protein